MAFHLGGYENKKGVLEARTDGLLKANDGSLYPLAIVECKAYVRMANQKMIEWQEGAQMACLISNSPRVPMTNYPDHGLLDSPHGSGMKR